MRWLALAVLLSVPATVGAQGRTDSLAARDTRMRTATPDARQLATACPANGAWIAASTTGPVRALVDSAAARPALIRDTTITFSIAERRWTWPALWAVVAAGVSGETAGTDAARWRACAGVGVTMENATLLLRGASGRVRFKADLSALRDAVSRPGTPAQPRD